MKFLNEKIQLVEFDEFVDMLQVAGWRDTGDAQHSKIKELYDELYILKIQLIVDRTEKSEGVPQCVLTKHIIYLNRIYAAGATTSYEEIQAEFGVTLSEAKQIVAYWDESYQTRL